MEIRESGENYLETILILQNNKGYVRSIDIAEELSFTKPSISRAMNLLKKSGYIIMEPRGEIQLTPLGLAKATEIYQRHRIISEYFIHTLGVDKTTAEQDACRIEHVISRLTFDKMKALVEGLGKAAD